jgi:hypothetical protein
MFKTELHCHSNDISACARVDADIIIEKFTSAGYSTLVLANHFNSSTYTHNKCESWNEWIDKYIGAYNLLKEKAKGKLNILLGMELRTNENINDYLVFGVTEKFLRENENIFKMNIRDVHKLTSENGMLLIQAHPFRDSMTVTNPKALDGVEVFNGHMGHDSRNDIAEAWANKFSLIKTSGTDFHYADVPANAGILTENEITTMDELVDVLKSGNYELVKAN